MWLSVLLSLQFFTFYFVSAVRVGALCQYNFQCERGTLCTEGKCRRDTCKINHDCAPGELCIKGRIDGEQRFACFPIDSEKLARLDLCPGGGKPMIGFRGVIETCDLKSSCGGRNICNPQSGICCSKLRICPWPKAPLLEGFTHKPLICQYRGTNAIPCPKPSYCEQQSGFCCADSPTTNSGPPTSQPQQPIETVKSIESSLPIPGESCTIQEGCAGGAVCNCPTSNRDCKCECIKEMGYSVSSDGKSCKRTRRRLKEKCRTDLDCGAAFSECTSGGCRCKSGFQRDGSGGCKPIAYKCVNHAEPLKFENDLVQCTVEKTHRNARAMNPIGDDNSSVNVYSVFVTVPYPEDYDDENSTSTTNVMHSPRRTESGRCPSNYYCVPVFDIPKKANLYQGFCCPMPAPDIPVCPVGLPHVSSAAPNYGCSECPMDHFCHKDSIATQKEICCPKPCVSPEDVYVEGQCYPIAYYGDSCHVSQQCVGKFASAKSNSDNEASGLEEINDMTCRKGICECPKGYLVDNGVCKRVECSVGLKGEPTMNSLGGILKCKRSADCSQGSMCDPFSHVCCKGINKCPSGLVETGETCKDNKCRYSEDVCIVPKNSKTKICCRREE
uniref:EB domain-containing protein n=1 Tax=Panagrellus redivivus TaxID=6233 RepID=A0A7E4V0F2_PANRE